MIDRAHDLPIAKQADALNISRGSVYYLPRPVSETDLMIMRRLDRNDAKVYQDPQHAPDVSFHGRNECVFRQKVHLSRQLQELARPV